MAKGYQQRDREEIPGVLIEPIFSFNLVPESIERLVKAIRARSR